MAASIKNLLTDSLFYFFILLLTGCYKNLKIGPDEIADSSDKKGELVGKLEKLGKTAAEGAAF